MKDILRFFKIYWLGLVILAIGYSMCTSAIVSLFGHDAQLLLNGVIWMVWGIFTYVNKLDEAGYENESL